VDELCFERLKGVEKFWEIGIKMAERPAKYRQEIQQVSSLVNFCSYLNIVRHVVLGCALGFVERAGLRMVYHMDYGPT
jgi:hypothetical protein